MIDYLQEISKIRKNKNGAIISLHKPLLLLLVLSNIKKGSLNRFLFDDIESFLKILISKYGLKNTNKINPQYPFVYLASSPLIWECSIKKKELKHPDAANRNEVMGKYANLNENFLIYLKNHRENLDTTIQFILTEFWPSTYHEEILNDLGIELRTQQLIKNGRGKMFVEEVLNAYERKCAVCGQSIRLGDSLIGIDACHLKPIQHFGSDKIDNGLALCKFHHWALDRGAMTISTDFKVLISPKINGGEADRYLISYEGKSIFQPREKAKLILEENILYHNAYIFSK